VIADRARDFVWLEQRLVARQARRRDNRRDRQLTALGWRPVRFTYEEIAFEAGEVAGELGELLRDQHAC
jgi:very-short-patch-repair endonuclease